MKSKKLKKVFYKASALSLARDLLGKHLVRKIGGKRVAGKIVETEAYIGPEDKASHAYQGKITERNRIEYLKGGYVYIYLCYGLYWQFNVTAGEEGEPECVLVRALEPLRGIKKSLYRDEKKLANLANGPGKLCRWMKLDGSFKGEDLCLSKRIWLEDPGGVKPRIVAGTRIGIDYAGSWAQKPWRFYISENPFVSRK